MDIGVSYMTWCMPDWDTEQLVSFAAGTDFDAVEFRVERGHAHGIDADSAPAERERVRDLFEEHGVAISGVATSESFGYRDGDALAENLRACKANIDLAGDLGAGVVRTFAGGDIEALTDETAGILGEAFTELGEYGADRGVTPVVEMQHGVLETPADGLAVAERVGTDNFGLLWNQSSMEAAAAEALEGWIRHVHLRKDVLDPGYEPIEATVERLAGIGFEGYLSLEIEEGENQDPDAMAATATRLRRLIDAT